MNGIHTALVGGASGSIGRPARFDDDAPDQHEVAGLTAEKGSALTDLTPAFATGEADVPGSAGGVQDRDSQLIADEPSRALANLDAVRAPRQQH